MITASGPSSASSQPPHCLTNPFMFEIGFHLACASLNGCRFRLRKLAPNQLQHIIFFKSDGFRRCFCHRETDGLLIGTKPVNRASWNQK
ncbi:hypothetical protein QKW52_05435 [Bacillus sonorensis]|nr:hypothetical protein [Bacillus sonorensis]